LSAPANVVASTHKRADTFGVVRGLVWLHWFQRLTSPPGMQGATTHMPQAMRSATDNAPCPASAAGIIRGPVSPRAMEPRLDRVQQLLERLTAAAPPPQSADGGGASSSGAGAPAPAGARPAGVPAAAAARPPPVMLWETVEVMLTALRDKCSTSAGGGGGGGTGVAAAAGALSSSAAAAAAGGRASARRRCLPAAPCCMRRA